MSESISKGSGKMAYWLQMPSCQIADLGYFLHAFDYLVNWKFNMRWPQLSPGYPICLFFQACISLFCYCKFATFLNRPRYFQLTSFVSQRVGLNHIIPLWRISISQIDFDTFVFSRRSKYGLSEYYVSLFVPLMFRIRGVMIWFQASCFLLHYNMFEYLCLLVFKMIQPNHCHLSMCS